jgi:hypothetical protein
LSIDHVLSSDREMRQESRSVCEQFQKSLRLLARR